MFLWQRRKMENPCYEQEGGEEVRRVGERKEELGLFHLGSKHSSLVRHSSTQWHGVLPAMDTDTFIAMVLEMCKD